jgi:hypothetical protein
MVGDAAHLDAGLLREQDHGAESGLVDRQRDVQVEVVLVDRKSTRLNSSHNSESRMPSSA